MINKRIGIKNLAEIIASEYQEKITPLDKIVEDEGLRVFYDSYGKNTFDGMTLYENGRFSIHINTDLGNSHDSAKGRFTLGHELGHYYIDSHRIGLKKGLLKPHPSRTNRQQFNKIEREADFFASCLLMPETRFSKDVYKKPFDIGLIDFLKEEYKVSRTAAAFRFADIGNHSIMIIYGEAGKIKWYNCSEDFPYKYLLHEKNVAPNSVMGEFFKDITDDIFKTEEIWAVDIFKYVKDDDINKKFFEHCITFRNRALSIVWGE
ncbi:ImmA/IrrE family metallo-endopeptidase [Maribacter sp. SA7]|uniref:ImmA/IrrE family metallo-endopeptidase n=1 Tax=Maribacter zhoushanensis TaxID=3030012 RepID=UPI0023EC1168|nr:ImmA/IrrE family metallo-endopeptidase [Maribacter zhoushanensis]MDF4203901.1 ImmA/IrrE family metallo-endopeptidase [Maribacter zhoushanensis]